LPACTEQLFNLVHERTIEVGLAQPGEILENEDLSCSLCVYPFEDRQADLPALVRGRNGPLTFESAAVSALGKPTYRDQAKSKNLSH
jgi:hypothetical protein